ncbi:uncharacterized protein G2W53_006219 [Senna tora]|uniref:Uncharacterized protein n=1 Tax=Senna tora TaxID=362788 RepID=A0A835CG92_9FABA|nr:uncharacterized protein G2W53_006219 [Senna tora]
MGLFKQVITKARGRESEAESVILKSMGFGKSSFIINLQPLFV